MMNESYNKRYKIIRHFTASLFLFMATAIFASCSGDMNMVMKENATVKITMKVPPLKKIYTRTSSLAGNEYKVNDLTVLIFNSDNQLIGEGYVSAPSAANDTYQLSVNTRKADKCTIYAVANAGGNAFTTGNGNNTVKGVGHTINTINDFKKTYSELSSTSDIGSQSEALMEGVLNNENIDAGNTTLTDAMPLYRICTMMNFNIEPASDIRITGYQLHEVPMSSYIANRTNETSPLYNPGNTFGDFSAVTLTTPTEGAEVNDSYYIYENLAGTESQSVDARTRNTYAPGTASYIDVYAVGPHWKSTYRIYLGGTGTTDYGNYNILRNYNYTYTISILSSGVYDVRVTCYPGFINDTSTTSWDSNGNAISVNSTSIGDYYFSDGSWGTLADHCTANVHPIGIIFSCMTSDNDRAHGWTHGYAMALTNANTSCVWGPYGTKENGVDVFNDSRVTYTYTGCNGVDYSVFKTDKDGYCETQAIANTRSSTLNGSYPAFWYALNYSITSPSGSSGWYLPSIGQWWDILINIGKMSPTPTYNNTGSGCQWSGKDPNGGGTDYPAICANNINLLLTDITTYASNHGYNYGTFDKFSNGNESYWSSTDCYDYYALFIDFTNSTCLYVYNNDKSEDSRVRDVIAF